MELAKTPLFDIVPKEAFTSSAPAGHLPLKGEGLLCCACKDRVVLKIKARTQGFPSQGELDRPKAETEGVNAPAYHPRLPFPATSCQRRPFPDAPGGASLRFIYSFVPRAPSAPAGHLPREGEVYFNNEICPAGK